MDNDVISRAVVTKVGLWSQIRVDHGREFYLTLFVQEFLRSVHGPSNILPFVQSTSKEVCYGHCIYYGFIILFQNLTVERIWPEVNSRVNYPLKRVLIRMQEENEFDLSDSTTKFCVSFVTCNTSRCGLSKFVEAWNFHSIPGIMCLATTAILIRHKCRTWSTKCFTDGVQQGHSLARCANN